MSKYYFVIGQLFKTELIFTHLYNEYISQESNYNVATNCFMSRGLDNHQATKLRVCTLVMLSAGK